MRHFLPMNFRYFLPKFRFFSKSSSIEKICFHFMLIQVHFARLSSNTASCVILYALVNAVAPHFMRRTRSQLNHVLDCISIQQQQKNDYYYCSTRVGFHENYFQTFFTHRPSLELQYKTSFFISLPLLYLIKMWQCRESSSFFLLYYVFITSFRVLENDENNQKLSDFRVEIRD